MALFCTTRRKATAPAAGGFRLRGAGGDRARGRRLRRRRARPFRPSGEILWQTSLTQILLDHGMEYAVFTAGDYRPDPIHLNDIEPVLTDGPYWKKGDLFLSFPAPVDDHALPPGDGRDRLDEAGAVACAA